jgi:hypothetical protein
VPRMSTPVVPERRYGVLDAVADDGSAGRHGSRKADPQALEAAARPAPGRSGDRVDPDADSAGQPHQNRPVAVSGHEVTRHVDRGGLAGSARPQRPARAGRARISRFVPDSEQVQAR